MRLERRTCDRHSDSNATRVKPLVLPCYNVWTEFALSINVLVCKHAVLEQRTTSHIIDFASAFSSTSCLAFISMASSTTVRVGVRVRPLTDQEIGHGGKSVLNASHPEIRLGDRRFTYDEVFEENLSQEDLYGSVSGPLLSSFLNGYNATVSRL